MKVTRKFTLLIDVEVSIDDEPIAIEDDDDSFNSDLKQRETRLLRLLVNDKTAMERLFAAHAWSTAAKFLTEKYETFDSEGDRTATGVIDEIALRMFGSDGDVFRDAHRRELLGEYTEDVYHRLDGNVIGTEIMPVTAKET